MHDPDHTASPNASSEVGLCLALSAVASVSIYLLSGGE
jgi:hypothetical protein